MFVNGCGRTFALARVARQGRPPKAQRRHHARGLDAGFTETRVFFVRLHVYFEKERGADSATKLMTSDRARRIAANIAKLPDLLGRRAPVEEQRRLYGAAARKVTAHDAG